jgi:hypothetical protein
VSCCLDCRSMVLWRLVKEKTARDRCPQNHSTAFSLPYNIRMHGNNMRESVLSCVDVNAADKHSALTHQLTLFCPKSFEVSRSIRQHVATDVYYMLRIHYSVHS